MGAVYLADDLRLPGRQCALKEVAPPLSEDKETASRAREALKAEAAVLSQLDHPGLPHVTDHFEADGNVFLVMDFVPGNDLKSILDEARRRGRELDEAQIVSWAEQLCDVLEYLHRQDPPVIHRDVKPANIKLTPDGQVRLVDFGLAAPMPSGGGVTATIVAGGGSRAYQPLEQHGESSDAGPRADIYALGATLYHLLSGHAPQSAQVRFLAPGKMPPLTDVRPGVSQRVASAVSAAMELHPDDRPASVGQLRRMLSGGAAGSTSGIGSGQWSVAVRRNAWLLALTVTLLLAALALTTARP